MMIASAWVFANVPHTESTDAVVEVQPGWGPKEVGDELQEEGVINSSDEFQQISQTAGVNGFPAGRYVFGLDITAQEALELSAVVPQPRSPIFRCSCRRV